MKNGLIVDKYGDQRWYKDDLFHRVDDDLPAVIHADGSKFWFINEECHRENGPAIMHTDGYISW